MSKTLILLGAGNSTRFGTKTKKQWLRVGDNPLWLKVTKDFEKYKFEKIIIVASKNEARYMQNFTQHQIIVGGDTRQESLNNALKLVDTKYTMVSDVARACIPEEMIQRLIHSKDKADIVVPYIKADDTVVYGNKTINRDNVKLIQTPQLSQTKVLKKALLQDEIFTDDSSAIKNIGGSILFVEGSKSAIKLTQKEDLQFLPCLEKATIKTRVGHGFDVHKFNNTPPLILGGIEIPCDYGFEAHSDGDVLIHALIDALLGSVGAGDIGEMFPDNDEEFKGIDSKILLTKVVNFLENIGANISNIDITIIAQKPRIDKRKANIRQTLAKILNINTIDINVKATTTEKLGFIGRSEGVGVEVIVNMTLGENK